MLIVLRRRPDHESLLTRQGFFALHHYDTVRASNLDCGKWPIQCRTIGEDKRHKIRQPNRESPVTPHFVLMGISDERPELTGHSREDHMKPGVVSKHPAVQSSHNAAPSRVAKAHASEKLMARETPSKQ